MTSETSPRSTWSRSRTTPSSWRRKTSTDSACPRTSWRSWHCPRRRPKARSKIRAAARKLKMQGLQACRMWSNAVSTGKLVTKGMDGVLFLNTLSWHYTTTNMTRCCNKSSPNDSKSCQESSHSCFCTKSMFLKIAQNSIIWTTLKLLPRTFKNRPILSHWPSTTYQI